MSSTSAILLDATQNWQRLRASGHGALLVCGAILALSLVVLLWFTLTSKRRQRHSRHHSGSRQFGVNPDAGDDPDLPVPQRRKRRRRRRDHRPRNPTLAETGGLPPIRRDGPSHTGP
jgi:hypothetical protein